MKKCSRNAVINPSYNQPTARPKNKSMLSHTFSAAPFLIQCFLPFVTVIDGLQGQQLEFRRPFVPSHSASTIFDRFIRTGTYRWTTIHLFSRVREEFMRECGSVPTEQTQSHDQHLSSCKRSIQLSRRVNCIEQVRVRSCLSTYDTVRIFFLEIFVRPIDTWSRNFCSANRCREEFGVLCGNRSVH